MRSGEREPLLGAHMSVAGGLHLAFERLREVGGRAMQLFTKNERQWRSAPLAEEAVERFRRAWRQSGCVPVAAHDSYLINLASPDPQLFDRSVAGFAEELRRAAALGIEWVIMHPGSHVGQGVAAGIARFASGLDRALELSEAAGAVRVLVETTAGQGTNLGSTFEEIARILELSRYQASLGVCFDTCHSFAAGYEIRTEEGYAQTFARFDRLIGLERLRFFHLNDSKREFGSRVDRHEHIGKGKIGLEAFRLLLNDLRFRGIPMVLETPKEKGSARDRENLAVLRSLIA